MHRLSRPSFVAAAAAASASTACADDGKAHAESSSMREENNAGAITSCTKKATTMMIPSPSSSLVRGKTQQRHRLSLSPSSYQLAATTSELAQNTSLLASSPITMPTSRGKKNDSNLTKEKNHVMECDYVVIGHGKAGQSAVRTIKRLDPSADIVIVDPNNSNLKPSPSNGHSSNAQKQKRRGILSNSKSSVSTSTGNTQHLTTRASHIDHSQKLIHVHPIIANNNNKNRNPSPSANNDNSNSDNTAVGSIRFRKSALLATGSRGAPPPESCIRNDARARTLELRSTSLQLPHNTATTTTGPSNPTNNNTANMPVLDPQTVRSLSIMAASQGASVAIMGSGFDALELAASCAHVSRRSNRRNNTSSSSNSSNTNDNNEKKIMLLFGNSSPMSNTLPRYLSAAVTKRMRQLGMEVEERSMTRYISMENNNAPTFNHKNNPRPQQMMPPRLELYTVKSYDNLDSKRINADLLVLAPSVDGLNGTAVVPTTVEVSTESNKSNSMSYSMLSSSANTNNFNTNPIVQHLPWSSLITPPLLTCFLDDGRIITNSEFNAASSLYAAGSAARYPDARTGRAEVAGGRHVSSEEAGEVAARNMVLGSNSSGRVGQMVSSASSCIMRESIPVWRSDVISYLPSQANHDDDDDDYENSSNDDSNSTSLALYSMGVHALCVGRCDSEGMATHGFWWTNTRDQQSSSSNNGSGGGGDSRRGTNGGKGRSNGNNGNGSDKNGGGSKSIGPNAFMRRATRRMATASSSSSSNSKAASNGGGNRGSLPVYGSGIVYYLSRTGSIEGIMAWGLPYSSNSNDVRSPLNDELAERMKNVIRSNGGVSVRDHSEKILEENTGVNVGDVGLLSYLHLAEESKFLASTALSGSSSSLSPGSGRKVSVLGRPLHRYTPTKSVELTNLGKMHRKDESGHWAEEDDLFYSTSNTVMASITTSTSLDATSSSTSMFERAEESGRPPSLKRVYPMQVGATANALVTPEQLEFEKEMKLRQIQNERARPPKEEPLWLRQGEEHRFVSKRDAMADSFLRNISAGRFSDGRDAVKQAPVPKVYLDAKEKFKELIGSDDGEGESNDD